MAAEDEIIRSRLSLNSVQISEAVIQRALRFSPTSVLDSDDHDFLRAVWLCLQGPGRKLVAGSLGVGVGNRPQFLYGSRDWTKTTQFLRRDGSLSARIWVEDSAGILFDVFTAGLHRRCMINGKVIVPQIPKLLEGSRESLERMGFHYLRAPGAIQMELLQRAHQLLCAAPQPSRCMIS